MKRKWNLRPLVGAAVILSVFLALQGCSKGPEKYSSGSWTNYKCTAKSGAHRATGWSTRKSAAKGNAMDKCRSHSANPSSCHIVQCSGG